MKFNWTPEHQAAFIHLKDAIVQAPILHYPNPNKTYIVYTDASDDACGAQLSQEHDGTEFPVAFLSHTFSETQCKWSTTKQRSLWSLLCDNQMELLPPGSQYNCPE